MKATLVLVTTGLSVGSGVAADHKQNPFTLVYESAITNNEPGKVNIHPVKYKLNGLDIAANVYTPANYDREKKFPAIVVAHPNGGVKEQVAGLYAEHLAKLGYITITADAAYQGGSGGQPRNVDKPAYRIEDIHGMADFITRYPGPDALGRHRSDRTHQPAATDDRRKQSLYMTEDAFAKATGTKDKELFKIEEATHIETYWVPKYVNAAMGKLTPFFARTLVPTISTPRILQTIVWEPITPG